MTKLEKDIWKDVLRLEKLYSHRDLDNDAHGIFQYAMDAAKILTWRYDHPMAYEVAVYLVDCHRARWAAAHAGSVG